MFDPADQFPRPPQDGKYVLRLYVTGNTRQSSRAIRHIKTICQTHLKDGHLLKVVALHDQKESGVSDQIVVAPTLVREMPGPVRRLVGDFSQTESVVALLDEAAIPNTQTRGQLVEEVAALLARLTEAEETLRAISSGEVDAVMVKGPRGDQLFTLKGADEPYRVLVEEMNQGAVTLAADGSILYCNRRFAQLLKTPVESLIGLAFDSFVAKSEQPNFSRLLKAGRMEGSAGEIMLCAADASEVPFQLAFSLLPQDSEAEMCLVATDISESRQKETRLRKTMADLVEVQRALTAAKDEAERANRAKSEFLSRMSHELRTPMNAILGFAQLLALEDLNADQREGLGHIMGGGEHLLELINEVLDISRIEAGQSSLSREPVEIAEALRESIELMQPLAAAADVRLEPLHVATTYVLADRQRLKQVLINLVSNAIKYNRAGGSVNVTCEVSGDGVRISVRDTGIGIPGKHLEQIFSPFERLGAEHGEIEGTGLGLTVAKRLVEAMKGTIGVESKAGEGSTFWIEFAVTKSPPADSELDRPPPEIESITWGEGGTVLYVEDNFSNLKLIERLFRLRPALKLIAARDGKSGLQMAREQLPALILVDLNLPDMNGRDILTKLRTEPLTSAIPVIALSADATPGQIERLMQDGAADYLTKPINVQKFLDVLDRTLNSTTQPARRTELRELRPAFETQP
jgi:signal transduction histidine kinase/FixJ family two-component response regulator